MIAMLMLACHHPALPTTFPGPSGRSCEAQRVVWVDPAPWTPIESVTLKLGENTAEAQAGRPIAVLPQVDVTTGFGLSVLGESGPASCDVVPTHPEAERLECGPYSMTVHYDALCAYPASVEPLDRKGRPEVANFILADKFGTRLGTPDVREDWNRESPSAPMDAYRETMNAGLARLDALDGVEPDWSAPHPLAGLFLRDGLLVDTRQRCTIDTRSFLEIELAHLQARREQDGSRHQTCGGRTPTDDVVDTLLTVTINGLDRLPQGAPFYGPRDAEPDPVRGDGVHRSATPPQTEFPWFVSD